MANSHSKKHQFNQKIVQNIANLANIPINDSEASSLAEAFESTIEVADNLKSLDVKDVEATYQVTGLENVLREDVVRQDWSLTQEEALANAKKTYQGFFVVERLIDEK